MTDRKIVLKSILWLLVGILITVSLARFVRGLGATTDLSDTTPWGLWIAFDVMSGVALAAGGFVIAAVVYIFHLRKFSPFTRPAILTAFLGYIAVAAGLLYDLGIPLNIWHPIIYPQPHSVLFEVALCVMLYLTVLFLEFCPVILEYPRFDKPLLRRVHGALKRATIPLVVLGIVLSTLHQSSLGSLFLIVPERVHPLWYSPIIWVLFFVSAAGLGLMTIAAETLFSAWYFGHKLRVDLLSNLAKAASFVLFVYAALRLGDLALRGKLGHVLDNTGQTYIFLLEMVLAALLPATLMAFRRMRSSTVGIGIASGLTLAGMVGYRFNLCVVAFARPGSVSYFPTWMEFAITLGIVATAMLVFIFFVEHLNVCETGHENAAKDRISGSHPSFNPLSLRIFLPESLAAARRYSLALAVGAAVAAAALPSDVWRGSVLLRTPVLKPMVVNGSMATNLPASKTTSYRISLQQPVPDAYNSAVTAQIVIIDGNRNGRLVAFPHNFHRDKLGGEDSCVQCHHQAMPFDQNTSCYECHRDMYLATDTFSHSSHIAQMDKNSGCRQCHRDATQAKTRKTAKACGVCHQDMLQAGSIIRPPENGTDGQAPGYMEAMHKLCITCHKQKLTEEPQNYRQGFADCATCHRDIDGTSLRHMSPYVASDSDAISLPKKSEVNPGGPKS
jgi:Ni/Fe-hydrogenase subunit HybB-like protein